MYYFLLHEEDSISELLKSLNKKFTVQAKENLYFIYAYEFTSGPKSVHFLQLKARA